MRKLSTAETLAAQIQDGATIAISGNGGGMVEADHIMAAIEERFLQTGHPRDLTLIHSLGIGDRDSKGTNRFAHAEMLKRIIAGHFTWSPKMQELVKSNAIEAYCFPGGVIQALLREIGAGRPGLFTHVGLGSFVDPRNGGGKSNECTTEDLVELIEIDGETKLRYRPFKVDYAILRGTYVQVIPYIYSVDAGGNEYNFLADYYRTTQELASNIFRKGYQWPFHATRVMDFGSSLLDMAVAQEQQSGRLVFMDFNRNPEPVPGDLPFSLDRLDDDVRAYLENNDALAPSPIERLQQMNPLSISLYKMHGYDLITQPLQFAMNNQHMNGGIEVDIWGQTSLPGCFAVGEVAGTHGVTRPGGAALNAGQVFAVRLARFIGCTQKRNIDGDIAQLAAPALASIREIITQAHDNGSGMPLSVVREKIQARMSDYAGFICHADKVRRATRDALLLNEFVQRHGLAIKHVGEVAELFMWRHMALTSAAVLTQLTHYIDAGGGSRGARMVIDPQGKCLPQTRRGVKEEWRFRSELAEDKNHKLTIQYSQGSFITEVKSLRMQPCINGIYFEKKLARLFKGRHLHTIIFNISSVPDFYCLLHGNTNNQGLLI